MHKREPLDSKKRYEDRWLEAFEKIENEIVQNKKNLTEAIKAFNVYRLGQRDERTHALSLNRKLGLSLTSDQAGSKRLAVINGKYAIVPFDNTFSDEIIDSLIKIINERREQIDCIVELGSGYGRNIFALADRLKPYQRGKQFEYFSCELTDSGRQTCKKLLKYSNEQKIHVEAFDYRNPNFSFLPNKKNYLFFTCHSIEQIPRLERSVIDGMLTISDNCYCLHAEPVGWQYEKRLVKFREETKAGDWKQSQPYLKRKLSKLNLRLFNKYGLSFMEPDYKFGIKLDKNDIDKPDNVSINAVKFSLEKKYNTNLVLLLKTIENEGRIKIDSEMINIYGGNPFNPTTEIIWRKVKN